MFITSVTNTHAVSTETFDESLSQRLTFTTDDTHQLSSFLSIL